MALAELRFTRKGLALAAGLASGIAVAATVAYLAGSSSADDQASPSGMSDRVEAIVPDLDRYVEGAMREADVPGVALGIVAGDELVYAKGFGKGADGQPVDAETMFEIGSATKSFLGATLAQMVDRGKLAWDDRVSAHHPDFRFEDPWVTREFRVEDLLAQRTGLAPYAADILSLLGYDPEDSIAAFAGIPAETSFRSGFAYQNVPHQVASKVVAQKAGARDWNEAVKRLLLDPLGMNASGTSADTLTGADNSTRGHQIRDGRLTEVAPVSLPEKVYGAGSIVSNVRDMSRWIRFQLNRGELDGERLLSREEHETTWRPRVAVTGDFADRMEQVPGKTQLSYGTGWFIHSVPEGRIVEHGGTTLGYTSAVRLDPDRKVGIVVLTNQSHAGGIAIPISKYAFDLLQGREPRDPLSDPQTGPSGPPEADPGLDTEKLATELIGTYRHPVGGRMEVAERDGELSSRLGPKQTEVRFEPIDRDTMMLTWFVDNRKDGPEMTAPVHIRREDGRVRGLTLADLEFERK